VYDLERDSERHRMHWRKYRASGIGPITRITDVPGESRGARLTPPICDIISHFVMDYYMADIPSRQTLTLFLGNVK
jgi:hypothetical protein